MGTAYIFITRSGVKRMLVNPSSTGKKFWPSFDVYIFGLLFEFFYCASEPVRVVKHVGCVEQFQHLKNL